MLQRFGCQQSLFPKCAEPCGLEILKGLHKSVSLGENKERRTRYEILIGVSYQFAKNPFSSIAPYGNPESSPDDNPYLAGGVGVSNEQ